MNADSQQVRLGKVNQFIRLIGEHGRRFFYNEKGDRYAHMELDERGRVWFTDDYTQERIYTHYSGQWRQFSHGGTLRDLVCVFRDHVKKGAQVHPRYLLSERYIGGNHPWAYPDKDLTILHKEGLRLGIIANPRAAPEVQP